IELELPRHRLTDDERRPQHDAVDACGLKPRVNRWQIGLERGQREALDHRGERRLLEPRDHDRHWNDDAAVPQIEPERGHSWGREELGIWWPQAEMIEVVRELRRERGRDAFEVAELAEVGVLDELREIAGKPGRRKTKP